MNNLVSNVVGDQGSFTPKLVHCNETPDWYMLLNIYKGTTDIISVGNFLLDSCSLHAIELKNLLNSTSQFLQEISTSPPEPTSTAWLNFFGDSDVPSVERIFSQMRVGDNVISDGVLRKPQLVCITSPQNPFWSWC